MSFSSQSDWHHVQILGFKLLLEKPSTETHLATNARLFTKCPSQYSDRPAAYLPTCIHIQELASDPKPVEHQYARDDLPHSHKQAETHFKLDLSVSDLH